MRRLVPLLDDDILKPQLFSWNVHLTRSIEKNTLTEPRAMHR